MKAEPTGVASALQGVTAVVVAVHGIGSQRRGDTVRYVATRVTSARRGVEREHAKCPG